MRLLLFDCYICFFFFFKQKTAYDMRISDWSSDVCSSDLGLSGLTRAFFYAGAKNLLVSHWPLLDEVAPRLTVRLLELMANDPLVPSAQALRQAMKEIRDDPRRDASETWAHPAVWAPFSVVGDGG